MRLFLFEHLCASGITDSSLRAEGWAMLSALVDDFQQVPECEVWTLLDTQCPEPLGHRCLRLADDQVLQQGEQLSRRAEPRERSEYVLRPLTRFGSPLRSLAAAADATLVIAPETDGVLSQHCRTVLEANGRWFGCTTSAIDLCTDKKSLGELWRRNGVPTPEAFDTSDFPGFPVVLKPRDGAGSQATFLVRAREDWARCRHEAHAEMPRSDFLVQRFVEGQPASVSFLMGPSRTMVPLVPATQRLSADGRFRYLGGELPLAASLAARAVRLGRRAVGCVPGLRGYVGVDLVLGAAEQDDRAIEINPRLTTSYLGLRRLFNGNLARTMWDVFHGRDVGELRWRDGEVQF